MRRDAINFTRHGSGEPLLLIHGLGSDLCVWEPVTSDLARDFDVIAVDLPGFGRSRPLAADVVPTPAALAQRLGQLLDELGVQTAHVAGNSLGGWVALELSLQGRARSVTGICPAGLWGAPLARRDAPAPGRAQRLARWLRPLIPLLLLSHRVRRSVLSPFVAHPERVPYHAAWRMVRSYARATAYAATSTAMRSSSFRGMGAVDAPVLLAFGERDRMIAAIRPVLRTGRSVLLPDCGHIAMWDDPGLVAAVIRSAARRRRAA
jgi:pimeloyl-ACP methyl ester carboxylesterase